MAANLPGPVPALADNESMFSVPGPSVQFVVGGIAARFTNEPESECSSIMAEPDEDDFDATVPMADMIARRRAALRVLVTREPEPPEMPEDEAPRTPEDEAPRTPEDEAPRTPEDEAPRTPEEAAPRTPEVKPKKWTPSATDVETRDGTQVELVRKPTASQICYTALHPAIYRVMQPLYDLDDVAKKLGDVDDWQVVAERIWPECEKTFTKFVNLAKSGDQSGGKSGEKSGEKSRGKSGGKSGEKSGDKLRDTVSESEVQTALENVITGIATALNRELCKDSRLFATVRGTLVLDHLEVRGVTDLVYSSNEKFVLAAEIKTNRSWPHKHYWYRKTRGVQVLNALYACRCPTLLVTEGHFKLFLVNDARDCVYTYPFKAVDGGSIDDRLKASVRCAATRNALFLVLVICLLKADLKAPAVKPGGAAQVVTMLDPDHAGQSTDDTPHHKSVGATPQTHGSPTPNQGQGSRALGEPAEAAEPAARFYTGVDDKDGKPIYQLIYVSAPQAAGFSSGEFSSDELASDELASDSSESEDPLRSGEENAGVDKAVLPTYDSAIAL